MILTCNFEELQALNAGAELLLHGAEAFDRGAVAAPAEALAHVALLQPRLAGAIEIETLEEQRSAQKAIEVICENLHERMEAKVLEFHPAHEEAVALYFDYAHAFSVLQRVNEIGARMTSLIELMTGEGPTQESAREMNFPD